MSKTELAKKLLEIKAVELRPNDFFTWASGIKSPIYCDNRSILSYPEIRTFLKKIFVKHIIENYPQTTSIAGVATGAIAIGALIADEMKLPFVYVRPKAKEHGRQNQIEGKIIPNSKVLVIEDLISTGGSSISAIEALKNENVEILGLLAIFSYEFDIAIENFKKAEIKFETLTNYSTLIQVANEENYIKKDEIEILNNWRKNFVSSK
jgi:orotate phosphoribosyltransferase